MKTRDLVTAALLASSLWLAGCVQLPTEKSGVSDLRPQLSFAADAERMGAARVSVDGIDVGFVGDYLSGQAALRVLPGTHRITVIGNGSVVLDEKAYFGDGVSRSFIVK